MLSNTLVTLATSLSTVSAVYQGFNYGSTYTDGSAITQSGFEDLFTTAQTLVGTSGFTSARLYTMIQAGTSNGIIEAIPAAINTKTTLLLGMWASAGQADFDNELAALTSAISTYGTELTDLLAGISVGSEDLYRITPTGIENMAGAGAEPSELISYVSQVRALIAGTAISTTPIGHVDTWTAWVNGSNDAVIAACDFLGMDAYPYFQNTEDNSIDVGNETFWEAYDVTVAASEGKDVWITETGWPVSGPTENLAVPSLANAKTYWDQVGCTAFGKYNTFWYTLQDAYPTTPSPSFGIVGTTLSTTPLYDLTCPNVASSSSSSSVVSAISSTTSATVATFTPSTTATLSTTDTAIFGSGTATSLATAETTAIETPVSTTTESASATISTPAGLSVPSTAVTTAVSTPAGITPPETSTTTTTAVSTPAGIAPPGTTTTTAVSTPAGIAPPETTTAVTTPARISSTVESATAATTTATTTATATACTTNILSGTYEFPHLIVPVSSVEPTTAYGTSYDGEVSSTVSSIFDFDIPASDAGMTCTLVFLFPSQAELTTSSYTISGTGGIRFQELSSSATEETTYDTVPSAAGLDVTIDSITPGNSYVVSSYTCAAGERIAIELSATGDLALQYFQDFNPSPIGLYISVC